MNVSGFAGVMLIMWDNRVMELLEREMGELTIFVGLKVYRRI